MQHFETLLKEYYGTFKEYLTGTEEEIGYEQFKKELQERREMMMMHAMTVYTCLYDYFIIHI